jgi:hypothetical protein
MKRTLSRHRCRRHGPSSSASPAPRAGLNRLPTSWAAGQAVRDLEIWNLRPFRIGRRKAQTPYGRLGLKVPDLSFGEFFKLTPEELREKLSAMGDTT